jgi:lantibiotic modifying enzyme
MPPGTAPVLRLSLFRGVAGMGYTLVRLSHPGRLPTPLAMQ